MFFFSRVIRAVWRMNWVGSIESGYDIFLDQTQLFRSKFFQYKQFLLNNEPNSTQPNHKFFKMGWFPSFIKYFIFNKNKILVRKILMFNPI